MTQTITHEGIIEKMTTESLFVRIEQTAACSACAAKGICSSSEKKEKVIEVPQKGASHRIGERVIIEGALSMGLKAVVLAYCVPLILLMLVLTTTIYVMEWPEEVAALAALGSLVVFYGILYLLRDGLKDRFSFKIKK